MAEAAGSLPLHYRLDDLRIDVARQRVVREGGQVVDVAGLSFRLLHYLITQGTRVVGFDDLIANVWAPAHVNEETVTQRVRLLRQALGDDGRQARYLRSVRGQGYQLCSEPVPDASADTQPTPPPRRLPMIIGAAALLVLALSGLAWWQWPAAVGDGASPLLERAEYYAAIGQRDNNERALALYRQRLQEVPDDMPAQLGISRALAARACLYNGNRNDVQQALTLAQAVVVRSPERSAAYATLGYAHDCLGEVDAALAAYEHAVQLNPDDDASRASAAYLYARKGRLHDALASNLAVRHPDRVRFWPVQVASNLELLGYTAAAEARYRRSFQLYPDNVFSNGAWPVFLYGQGRTAEAQAALDEAMARGTEHAALYLLATELALQRGDQPAARSAALQARALKSHASLPGTVAWITGATPVPAATVLRQQSAALQAGLAQGADPLDGVEAALLAELAGDRQAALQALNAAVASGYRDAAYLRVSPLFSALRADPGFAAVLQSVQTHVATERARVIASGILPEDARQATAAR